MEEESLKPRIRFKGFTEDWEQRKLEDFVSYTSSSLSIGDALKEGVFDLYDANELIGKTNIGEIKQEYITIIKDGAGVGRVRLLPKNTAFIGTMGALTTQNNNIEFVYQYLVRRDLSKSYSGSTIPHIYFKDYGKDNYLIPSIFEQDKIASIFNDLDNLITLHQCKLI